MVERRLGRGLDFFLSGGGGNQPAATTGETVEQVEVAKLTANPHQPRTDFPEAELEALASSIRSTGVLQPILVRKVRGGALQIIAGERRWRAAQRAGLERIPALVRDVTDEMTAVFALVENLQRADLNAIEKAQAFKQIQDLTKASQADVARQVGLDRSTITNFMRLLDLPEEVQAHVSRGTLSMGHARALLGLKSPDEQRTVAEEILKKRLSVRQVEELVQDIAAATQADNKGSKRKARKGERPVWLNEIEDTLAESLRTAVAVRYGTKRSKITIECRGRDEFERLYEALKGLAEK